MAITSEYKAGSAINITKLNKWFGDFHVLRTLTCRLIMVKEWLYVARQALENRHSFGV